MHPDIVEFGPFAIRSYGLMLAIGFVTGIFIAAHRAERRGENPDHIFNLAIWVIVSALIGARLYYVFTHFDEFVETDASGLGHILLVIRNIFWPVGPDGHIGLSGLILYGGLIAATLTTVLYLWKHRLNVLKYLDIIAPSLGIGEFFTRIGCFLNGCCYGTPTDGACGVVFPPESAAGYFYPNTPLHPSQLYMAAAGLTIFGLLLFLERFKRFNGYLALWYFILYSIGRFLIDFTRHYENQMVFGGLSQNQIISIVVFAAASTLLVVLQVRAGRTRSVGKTHAV